MLRSRQRNDSRLSTVVGTAVGVAGTAAALWLIGQRRRDGRWGPELERTDLERSVREAFREDDDLGRRGVLVTELGSGIVELAGVVESDVEARRAMDLANGVEGVHTVVNRLTPRNLESHLAETRERFQNGDSALTETRWTGMNVGMGRRRQSPETDPPRRDDHAKLLDRELRAERVAREELMGTDYDPSSDWTIPASTEGALRGRDNGGPRH